MFRARTALPLLAMMAAVPLNGCVVAAVPVLAGAAIARSETKRKEKKAVPVAAQPKPIVTVGVDSAPTAAAAPAADAANLANFTPLLDHVRSRVTLWSEGAPIKSLVLDNRQTVLNPVAIDCQRRKPVVLIDLDPADASTAAPLSALSANAGWLGALAEVRKLDVGIIWITDRAHGDVEAIRTLLAATALDPLARDPIMARHEPRMRKQDLRLEMARSHCVLAVVGDKRGDADEAYDFLRSPNAALPIDSNWGAGWFLLPPPMITSGAE